MEPMDEEQIHRIDKTSIISENIGVHFRDPIAIADWKNAGAKVVDETADLDRHLVKAISTIPRFRFTPAIRPIIYPLVKLIVFLSHDRRTLPRIWRTCGATRR